MDPRHVPAVADRAGLVPAACRQSVDPTLREIGRTRCGRTLVSAVHNLIVTIRGIIAITGIVAIGQVHATILPRDLAAADYANRVGEVFQRITTTTTHANARPGRAAAQADGPAMTVRMDYRAAFGEQAHATSRRRAEAPQVVP